MSLNEVLTVVSMVVSIGSLVAWFYTSIVKLAKFETRLEILWANQEKAWDFQMRRAEAELISRNMGKRIDG